MKKVLFLTVIIILTCIHSFSQESSRNGYHHSPYGTLRSLLVFAEVVEDPYDKGVDPDWLSGSMPLNANFFFEPFIPENGPINAFLTKYFFEASFGNFIFLGDYFPELVSIHYDSLQGKGEKQVIQYLNTLDGDDITTANGFSVNSGDFDKWTLSRIRGERNTEEPDGKIDMLFIIWRVNSRINIKSGGYINTNQWNVSLKKSTGFNDYSSMVADSHIMPLLRHEFSHSLLGGNRFHTGGAGAGPGMFLSDIGGYGLLSSWNRNMDFVNGWDRLHLGWKNPDNKYIISARDIYNNEVPADLTYGEGLAVDDGIFVLRDFAKYGDAVRIKLPYIRSENPSARDQWIWIENHQLPSDMIHYKECLSRGIYVNIQIGNNELTTNMNSRTNYIYPLSGFGNYDWDYLRPETDNSLNINLTDDPPSWHLIASSGELSNPFTGYHPLMLHAIDYIEPTDGRIFSKELITPSGIKFNGILLKDTVFCYRTFPVFGSIYDAFLPGRKISVSGNPAPVPLLTYHVSDRFGNSPPHRIPSGDDNRTVYLNGLSVEIVEQRNEGEVVLRIRWDDYEVGSNLRWCGPVVLNEKINLTQGSTILLDQGLTPTRPVDPAGFNDVRIFADPTSLRCREGSFFKLGTNSRVEIKNGSSLILDHGSTLELDKGAVVTVYPNSILRIKKGAAVNIFDNGKIEIHEGAVLCVEEGAEIALHNRRSSIITDRRYDPGLLEHEGFKDKCDSYSLPEFITGKGSVRRRSL